MASMASMASLFKFDLKFEISNVNNPGIIVHVASNSHFGGPINQQGEKIVRVTPFRSSQSNPLPHSTHTHPCPLVLLSQWRIRYASRWYVVGGNDARARARACIHASCLWRAHTSSVFLLVITIIKTTVIISFTAVETVVVFILNRKFPRIINLSTFLGKKHRARSLLSFPPFGLVANRRFSAGGRRRKTEWKKG